MPTKQGFAVNLALLLGAAIPSFIATYILTEHCPALANEPATHWWRLSSLCRNAIQHPVWALNAIYFVNVNVIFWLISLWQESTWLIDPYWTFIPPLIAHFYAVHPTAHADPTRARVVLSLVWLWAIRLTHSYFRREEWKLGEREDWRFTDMRKTFGANWWWISFFAVYISQHVMLIGITLPFYAVFSNAVPFRITDWLIACAALSFIVIAFFADTQLREFMKMNEARVAADKAKIPILKSGLWKWSRHPKLLDLHYAFYRCHRRPVLLRVFSYFGELSWWWSVAFFGHLKSPLYFAGTIANTAAMAVVTYMVEKRMSAVKDRLQAWNAYKAITSVWVPLPLFLFFSAPKANRSPSPTRKPSPKRGRPARVAT